MSILSKRRGSDDRPASEPLVTHISAERTVSMRFYLRELLARRDLIRVLVGRELKSQYEMNIVGFTWWLLEPASLTMVYVLVVQVIFDKGKPGYPLLVLCALLAYKWLASALIGSMNTVRGHANLITDVYFPRALLPLVEVVVGLAHFLVGLCIIPILMVAYRHDIAGASWQLLWMPLIVFVEFVLILGLAYPMTVWGLRFRNLSNLSANLFRIWFYLTPGIWELSDIADRPNFVLLVKLNPLTGIFVSLKNVILHAQRPDWELGWSFLCGLLFIALGARYFIKREAQFGKQV